MEWSTGCVSSIDHITGRESGLTSFWCFTRENWANRHMRQKQMTTAQAVGAVSREAAAWYAIDWQATHRNVRRLQVRIVQATKASRWGKVQTLQRLLIPRNRVSPKEAFEGLELCERKLSCTVLRGLDGSNPVRLLGNPPVVQLQSTVPRFVSHPA